MPDAQWASPTLLAHTIQLFRATFGSVENAAFCGGGVGVPPERGKDDQGKNDVKHRKPGSQGQVCMGCLGLNLAFAWKQLPFREPPLLHL